MRIDHELNEVKLARAMGASDIELADAGTVQRTTGAPVGFAGPVGYSGEIFVDTDARQVADGVCGANQADQHLLHVVFGRDYTGKVVDLRSVVDGDAYLIFPELARPDGEWPVWFFGAKNPGAIAYASFGAMLARERGPALEELRQR